MGVKTDEIKAQLFNCKNYIAVKINIVGRMHRFRVIAMLTNTPKIHRLSIQPQMHTIRCQPTDAKLSGEDGLAAYDLQCIQLGFLR